MDSAWLTAFVGVAGALLGAIVTGLISRWNTTKQLETQERIAAAGRADDREKLLLTECRVLYGEVLDQARGLYGQVQSWAKSVEILDGDLKGALQKRTTSIAAGEPPEVWEDEAIVYESMERSIKEIRALRRDVSVAMLGLELIAPADVAEAARQLKTSIEQTTTVEDSRAEAERFKGVYNEFVRACRKSLGADPDEPTKALQAVQ